MSEGLDRPATSRPGDSSSSRPRRGWTPSRWLVALWVAVGLSLAGQIVDLGWHARHGEFQTASDVAQGHSILWLATAMTIAVCLGALRSGHTESRRGYSYVLAASVALVVADAWNFSGHVQGQETFIPHLLLTTSKGAILVAVFVTTHAVMGRDEHPGLFEGPKHR